MITKGGEQRVLRGGGFTICGFYATRGGMEERGWWRS